MTDSSACIKLVWVTNQAYDVLLMEDQSGLIVSWWDMTTEVLRDFLNEGLDARLWDVQDGWGLESDGRPAIISDWGTPILSAGEFGAVVLNEGKLLKRLEHFGYSIDDMQSPLADTPVGALVIAGTESDIPTLLQHPNPRVRATGIALTQRLQSPIDTQHQD